MPAEMKIMRFVEARGKRNSIRPFIR